jgi:TatD DNase family protein
MLIDTHCHLNEPSFSAVLPQVISRAVAQEVETFIVPAYDRASLARTFELADAYEGVIFPAYGIHPWYIGASSDMKEVRSCAAEGRAAAIGEIGLDFSPGLPAREVQEATLISQLDLAVALGLPVLLHCRKAHEALREILEGYGKRLRGVMHSFSGSLEQMEKFLDFGLYIAFSGAVTRQMAKKYHRNAIYVPAGRMLLETDAPSIATETTPASRVEPSHTVEVARKLAELRGVSFEEICVITTDNARRLFSLP